MGIKLVVAVTHYDWFQMLRRRPELEEINFWAPHPASFKALQPGELFLFKLRAPHNVIVGGGIFAYATAMPWSLAWEAFDEANGAYTAEEMRDRIADLRGMAPTDRSNFEIGCRILTQPFFFDESLWIPAPASWSPNIVSLKTYSTDTTEGMDLWAAVTERMPRLEAPGLSEGPRYGAPHLVKPRLGQGAFRLLVTDIYERRCVVTRERTLPALEAAHIRPYRDGGQHEPSNGLLLRRDIHSLFDAGYVTVTPDLHFEVSRHIREDYENGRDYYALHGRVIEPPKVPGQRPDPAALTWHNEERFRV